MSKSDYTKPYTQLYDLLPSVDQSEVNKAIIRNVFDRFLTKTELVNVVGTLTRNSNDPRRIPEIDVHRQSNQLQPLLNSRIATEDNIASFMDLIREMVRMGADYSKINEWLSANQSNFCPPIDLDKNVNYLDYYWFDQSEPQYITIKNRLTQLSTIIDQAYINNPGLEILVNQYTLETDPTQKQILADQIEVIYPGFIAIYDEYLYNILNQKQNITNVDGWDGILNGLPLITVNYTDDYFEVYDNHVQVLSYFYYESISIDIQYGTNSVATYIINALPIYNPTNNTTRIYTTTPIIGGITTSSYVKIGTYDYVDDGLMVIDFTPNTITISGNYQDAANILGECSIDDGVITTPYTIITAEYEPLLSQTIITVNETVISGGLLTGFGCYDSILNPIVEIENPNGFLLQNDPWSTQNKWVHISDIPTGINLSTLQRAEQPIIEYDAFIELNAWSQKTYNWYYSGLANESFTSVDFEPIDQELLLFNNSFPITNISGSTIEVNVPAVIDYLVPNNHITISYDDSIYQYFRIVTVTYNMGNTSVTLELDQVVSSTSGSPFVECIRYTSRGDDWKGFRHHWVYKSANVPITCDTQVMSDVYDSNSSNYDPSRHEILFAAGQSIHWYVLNALLVTPYDDVRVYINGNRVYGEYAFGSTTDGINFSYDTSLQINAIWFYSPIIAGNIVIEVGPAAATDEDRRLIPVRTDLSDPDQVISLSLVKYVKMEQQKTEVNQYPLFNMFNLDGTSALLATPLWKFQESQNYPVNRFINKRVKVENNTFFYDQLLLDDDNERMYAYKQYNDLKLVWKNDLINLVYTPQYRDVTGAIVPVGDPSGDWELPKQMSYNIEHENRKYLSSVDLFQHFSSIIAAQPIPPGFTGSANGRWRLLTEPQYGAGGTIKEFSDGFDTFLSSLFVRGVNFTQLIDFAKQQYDSNLHKIENIFISTFHDMVSVIDSTAFSNFIDYITQSVISIFEEDDFLEKITGDTTMYQYSGKGIRNWIATLPKFGLLPLYVPTLMRDLELNLRLLRFHDGHEQNITLHNSTIDQIYQTIRRQGNVSEGMAANRPSIVTTSLGHIYVTLDTREMYKNIVSSYGGIAPIGLPDNALWYDTIASQLKLKQGNTFVVVPDDTGWFKLDVLDLLAETFYEVEQRLYAVSDGQVNVYPVTSAITQPNFDEYEYREFLAFTAEQQIASPLNNSNFYLENSFSWNYSAVDVNTYNILAIPTEWNGGSPSTWYNLYESLFNTRYPQIEPWVLQGYGNKPSWWDAEYKGTTRRWSTTMWHNIRNALVPQGKQYPTALVSSGVPGDVGYVVDEGITVGGLVEYMTIPVNSQNTTTSNGMFGPDELLPPYFVSSNPSDASIVMYGSLLTTMPNQSTIDDPFEFGQNGPVEDVWRHSIEYNYALTKISYLMDPMRFTYYSFGTTLKIVSNIQVDVTNNFIPSHKNTLFHGDLVHDQPLVFNGLNQWLVNFMRYNAKDLDISDFRTQWTGWVPTLGYQTTSFVESDSVQLSTDTTIFDQSDYQLRTKRTPGFKDYFLESLRVAVASVGSSTYDNGVQIPIGNGSDWKFKILTSNPKYLPIKLYGIHGTLPGTTFNVLDRQITSTTWTHHPVNKDVVIEFLPGDIVDSLGADYAGIQGLVNFIDGYVEYLKDVGFVFNDISYATIDPTYGRLIDWQLEEELLIQQIYTGMVTDQLPINFIGLWNYIIPDLNTNEFLSNGTLKFGNGDTILFHSTSSLPAPIVDYKLYTVVNVNGNRFQVMEEGTTAVVTITTLGRGTITIGNHKIEATVPQAFYEVNPFKFVVVFDNKQGIISNIQSGSFNDIITERGIYDQNGNIINSTALRIYRGDTRSVIRMTDTLSDPSIPGDTLHIAGMHLFLDGYEHVILFSNVSLEQGLIFDEFLGTQITKINVNYHIGNTNTFRPNIGGRFLLDDKLITNIEASVGELQTMYDAYSSNDQSVLTLASRRLLGFEEKDYLTGIGITLKSQFTFYRGMIQQKGSINAVDAYINLRQFIDAKVDDYWAYKVSDFGDSRPKVYPELNLISLDTYSNKLMLQFIQEQDPTVLGNFTPITLDQSERWYNSPSQMRNIFAEMPNLYFNATVRDIVTKTGSEVFAQQYIKLPTMSDNVVVIARQTNRQYQFVMNSAIYIGNRFPLNERIVPESNCIIAGVSRQGSDFYPVLPTSIGYESTGLAITIFGFVNENGQVVPIMNDDVIRIQITNAVLKADLHYTRINSQLIYFNSSIPLQNMNNLQEIKIYGMVPNVSKQVPFSLIDYKSATEVVKVSYWDPAYDYHYYAADHIIDMKGIDPATYTDSLVPYNRDRSKAWDKRVLSTVWMDTTKTSYKPYNDTKLWPNVEQRLERWGQLEDWSSFVLYEWTESTVHPNEYDQYIVDQQRSGLTIAGQAKKSLFQRNRNTSTNLFDVESVWIENEDVVLTGILPIVDGYVFTVAQLMEPIVQRLTTQGATTAYINAVTQHLVADGQIYNLYRDGILLDSGVVISGGVDITFKVIGPDHYYTIVIPAVIPTEDQLEFNPDVEDDLSINIQYRYDYNFTKISKLSANGVDTTDTYYFWAYNTSTIRNGVTLATATTNLIKTPQPYVVFDNFVPQYNTVVNSREVSLPDRFTRCVIRGLVNRVTDDNRFKLQFTRDFTLRDELSDTLMGEVNLKNKHSQWKMFRQRQKYNIDHYLWKKLTEACSGRLLSDPTKVVPSLDYSLSDEVNGTNIRFGMDTDQTFIESTRGIEIIISEISNPDYNLYPIDREAFLAQYPFDTPDNIELAMSTIYETFLPEHVNRIWFAVFMEALSYNVKYTNIFKTSWIQLDGVRLLDTSGVLE